MTLAPQPTPRLQPALAPAEPFDFEVPPALEASAPPEARGLARDGVRLMVSSRAAAGPDPRIDHAHFYDLPQFLRAGDMLVINTSGTLNAALKAIDPAGQPFELHLSTRLPADLWIVEVRRREGDKIEAVFDAHAGTRFKLPARGAATLLTPYRPAERGQSGPTRLWIAALELPEPLADYLTRHGFPIRYSYVHQQWPLSAYQTVYVTEMGSAEMPSAGRAFTPALLTRLMAQGVQIAPLLLHTGIAALEDHEGPYEEFYRVPPETARAVSAARAEGRRILAVGTTVVRALQTVTDERGVTHPGEGWTTTFVTPETGARSVDGLLTGLHEPRSTHRLMLEAIASPRHLQAAYEAALAEGYLWHEFGDLHLILP